MKLYKFKSLANFEFVADILVNKRLYAANFTELNDPMEGIFTPDDKEEFINAVKDEKLKLRVCSMAQNISNPLLWAHYADSFKGVCIEVEVDESLVEYEKINYTPFTAIVGSEPCFSGFSDKGRPIHKAYSANEWAKVILRNKFEEWRYEEEVRLFSNNIFISNGINVTGLYLGLRVSDIYKEVLNKISADIKIYYTKIDSCNQVVKV
ncbi:hypothetical protein CRV00_05645 [Malaciobacter molluscorum]|uniref:DUF2971 domain-containing protein n=1 Tax=Malaciobacter molluscorum TaxID=1032072 RepID=UPI00100C0E69|nr:DUF2971 domain-containing protein [Malaciobacter molluscorum]RXJ94815.1 hypothetical protein CRV00_05645 [Malaciobacter molluscorum]